MHQTVPEVFLIARPSIDIEGMRRYLKAVDGESWLERRVGEPLRASAGPQQTDRRPGDGELLVEFSGRTCYRSWEPGLNPNVTKVRVDAREYFANLLRSGHGSVLEHASYSFALRDVSRVFCYDAETEVLTRDGWKAWPQVDGSETFATLNPDSGHLEYQRASEHFVGEYDGAMYRVRSEQVDLLVTPNHRMWVKAQDAPTRERCEPFRVRLAREIFGTRVAYQKTASWSGREAGTVKIEGMRHLSLASDASGEQSRVRVSSQFPLKQFARLLGHWLAADCAHALAITESHASQTHPLPPEGAAQRGSRDRRGTAGGALAAVITPACCAPAGEQGEARTSLPAYVHTWGPPVLRAFLLAYAQGIASACGEEDRALIRTASPRLADELQVLAIKAGWAADVRTDEWRVGQPARDDGRTLGDTRLCYTVSLADPNAPALVNDEGTRSDSWERYAGKVYCVQVPNGLLFVRRNGKAVVSGNTHELVRHRAGSAFSQESLRYVRLADIGFRVPPALEPVRERVLSIVEQLEEFQLSAASELGIDAQGVPFHIKKQITSALRRLAPIGLSTDIIWSANVRTLRHVIEMRTDPSAEEELRLVFDLIAAIMQSEAPLLFQDFSRHADGSWVPEHKKV